MRGYVYVCIYTYACVCVCLYIYICVKYMCICVRIYRCGCMCICLHVHVWVSMYVYVCGHMSMHVRGPITPCGLAAGGAVFIRVRTPNLTGTLCHPTGWLISNFLIALTRDIIFLSQCRLLWCTFTSGTLMHPNLAHLLLTINQQQGRESNKLAFCSSLTTSTLVPNPITTDSYFLTLNGPASNTYAKFT